MAFMFATISRATAEKVFITVRNADSKTLSIGNVAHWYYVATTEGVAPTGDGYSVTHALTTANNQLNPAFAAGIVANTDIGADDYGELQVYGTCAQVSVAGVDGATPFVDLFTANSNTDSHLRLHVLKPVNAFGNTTGAVTNIGYMAPIALASTIAGTQTYVSTDVNTAMGATWPGGYAIPLSNPIGGVTIDTDSTGSVMAFLNFL